MNIIVVGCGKVGLNLADQLNKEGHDITIIDNDEKELRHAVDFLDVMGVHGNGAMPQTLREAGIAEADVLIAATNQDEVNMLCCLFAKKEGQYCSTIARIRDPQYTTEIKYLRDELNLAMVINPEMAAAKEIERLLRFPSAIKIDSFSRGRLDLIRAKVPEESQLVGIPFYKMKKEIGLDVLVCCIERGEEVLIPKGSDCFMAGDEISFIASTKYITEFFLKLGLKYTPIRDCMIVGGGRVSYYIAKYIEETHLNLKLKIIDSNKERCDFLAEELPDCSIINGNGIDQELLKREGIETTDAFCSLTGFDEENIMLSLYAGKLSKTRLITKVNRITFENVIREMNLGSVIYPKQIIADSIVRYVRALENSKGSNVETLYKIADGRAEALEFRVLNDPNLINIPLSDIQLNDGVLICGIIRNHRVITPNGSDMMKMGDRVIIVTKNTGYNDLRDILKKNNEEESGIHYEL